jgi:hypothetical protein
MCYLTHWRRPRTRIRNLIKLGTRILTAVGFGLSSKGPYRLSRTLATQSAALLTRKKGLECTVVGRLAFDDACLSNLY